MKKFGLKFFSLMVALLVAVVLTGCAIKQGTKIEFAKLPAGVYTTESGEIDLNKVAIKINDGAEMSLKDAQVSYNITITGNTWSTWGEYTLVVILDNAAITFNYEVVQEIVEVTYDTTWDGQGTESDPWQISSEEELKGLAAVVNGKATVEGLDATCAGKYFKLTANIDLTPGWEPIGAGNRKENKNLHYFAGNFDGDNKVISGLTNVGYNPVEVAGSYSASSGQLIQNGYVFGLFGIVSGATIKNVVMENVYTEDVSLVIENQVVSFNLDSVGSIVGYVASTNDNSNFIKETVLTTIENCQVLSGEINGFDATAGIVGRAYGVIIANKCSNSANISSTRKGYGKSGGIVGIISSGSRTTNSEVLNCVNNGNIINSGTTLSGAIVGRIMVCSFKELSNTNNGRVFVLRSGEVTEVSTFGSYNNPNSHKYHSFENTNNWSLIN